MRRRRSNDGATVSGRRRRKDESLRRVPNGIATTQVSPSTGRARRRSSPHLAVTLGVLAALGLVAVLASGTGPGGAAATAYNPVAAGEELPSGFIQMVPRDFIEAVHSPAFVSAGATGWPDDADVIGVEVEGESKAYPVSLLTAREMVVDVVGGVPVLVTWCPVCGTAMAHRRMVGGETLVFGVQGALYLNAMTWWDHDSGSVWSQPLGTAIAGPRKGQALELLPAAFTTWASWRETHPDTLALDAPGTATGFDLANLLVVVDLGNEVRGYPVTGLRAAGVVNDVVGGVDVAVVSDPRNPDRWAVFSRRLGGTVVDLEVDGATLRDRRSGSTFDPGTGRGLGGPLGDLSLVRLPATTSIPGFGPTRTPIFLTLWPDATVWRP